MMLDGAYYVSLAVAARELHHQTEDATISDDQFIKNNPKINDQTSDLMLYLLCRAASGAVHLTLISI